MKKSATSCKCTICGNLIEDGAETYWTSSGTCEVMEGMPHPTDNMEYHTYACKECGEKITELISMLLPEKTAGEGIRLALSLYDKASTETPPRKLHTEVILGGDISIEIPNVPTAPNCENEAILIECCDDKLQLRAWDDTQEDPVTSKNWGRR